MHIYLTMEKNISIYSGVISCVVSDKGFRSPPSFVHYKGERCNPPALTKKAGVGGGTPLTGLSNFFPGKETPGTGYFEGLWGRACHPDASGCLTGSPGLKIRAFFQRKPDREIPSGKTVIFF